MLNVFSLRIEKHQREKMLHRYFDVVVLNPSGNKIQNDLESKCSYPKCFKVHVDAFMTVNS